MNRKASLIFISLLVFTSCNNNQNNEDDSCKITVDEAYEILSNFCVENNMELLKEDNYYTINYDRTSPIGDLYSNSGNRIYTKESESISTSYDDNNKVIEENNISSNYVEKYYYTESITNTQTTINTSSSKDESVSNVWIKYDEGSNKNLMIIDSPTEKSLNSNSMNFNSYPYQTKYYLFDGLSAIISSFLTCSYNALGVYEYPDNVVGINNPNVESGSKETRITKKELDNKIIIESNAIYKDYVCTYSSTYNNGNNDYDEDATLKYNVNQTISFILENNKITSISINCNYTLDARYEINELGLHQHIYSKHFENKSYTYGDEIDNMNSIPSDYSNFEDKRR